MSANLAGHPDVEEIVDDSPRPTALGSALLVARWELRRITASRVNLVVAAGAFLFFVAIIGIKHEWLVPVEAGSARGMVLTVFGSTALGAIFEVVGILLLFFGMLIPFLAAGAVSHDYQDRTHEILMATSMPSASYVLGRFTAAVLTGIGAALVLILAIVAGNELLHASDGGYPAQDVAALLMVWLVLVVPAVIVLTGISFLLGTLLPRLLTPARVMLVLVWAGLSVVVDIGHGLGWFGYWTPTGNGVLKVIPAQVAGPYAGMIAAGAAPSSATHVQDAMPNLWPWVGPHLGLVVFGIAAGLAAAAGFRRFRGVMG